MNQKTNKKILKHKESRITSEDIDKCPDIETLLDLKSTIEASLVDVKQQLETAVGNHAKNGAYADPEWWAKANGAKRVLGYLHQRILMKERAFKHEKKEKEPNSKLEHNFMDCAKELLPPETFYQILSEAHKKIDSPWVEK